MPGHISECPTRGRGSTRSTKDSTPWLFLRDSGYPLRSYLVTSVTNLATPEEERFTQAHTDTRMLNGSLVGGNPTSDVFIAHHHGGLRWSPVKGCAVTVVTTLLHYIAVHVRADEPPPVDDEDRESLLEDDDDRPNAPLPHNAQAALHQASVQVRQELINLV